MLQLMGWLHSMNWIDIVLLIAFVLGFWTMVLALTTSLFGGHRYLESARIGADVFGLRAGAH